MVAQAGNKFQNLGMVWIFALWVGGPQQINLIKTAERRLRQRFNIGQRQAQRQVGVCYLAAIGHQL